MPGTAALNKGGSARITSVSCASVGNCSAGGFYADASGAQEPFVVSEVRGRWRNAEEVTGLAGLNTLGDAAVTSVSCGAAGNCSAVGNYRDRPHSIQLFVISEVRGRWRKAVEVPGIASLNKGAGAQIASVSCASAGNCSAGGYYMDVSHAPQAFVVSEVRGRWRKAEEVPGTAALNAGGFAFAEVTSVSCASAGNCSAGGFYQGAGQAFVVSEVRGRWQNAEEVPGTAALNVGNAAETTSVSCASAGNCSAGGNYLGASLVQEAFVVSEVHGRWQRAEEVTGRAGLNTLGEAAVTSVSCGATGNCSAVGSYYASGSRKFQVFVVSEVRGRWRKAEEVPGTAALNKENAWIASVSCASAGNCSAGGSYQNMYGGAQQAFVVSEVNGIWRKAEKVPGTAGLNTLGDASVTSVSCSSAGRCSAGGYYTHFGGRAQAFVVSRKVISRK